MASSNSLVSATGGTYSSSSLVVDGAVELVAAELPVAVGANVKAAEDDPLDDPPKLNPELAGLVPKIYIIL